MKGHERPLTFLKYNREGDLLFSCAKDHTPMFGSLIMASDSAPTEAITALFGPPIFPVIPFSFYIDVKYVILVIYRKRGFELF